MLLIERRSRKIDMKSDKFDEVLDPSPLALCPYARTSIQLLLRGTAPIIILTY